MRRLRPGVGRQDLEGLRATGKNQNGPRQLDQAKRQCRDKDSLVGSAERATRKDSKVNNSDVQEVVRLGWEKCSTKEPGINFIAVTMDGRHETKQNKGTANAPWKHDVWATLKGTYFVAREIALDGDLQERLRAAGIDDGCVALGTIIIYRPI